MSIILRLLTLAALSSHSVVCLTLHPATVQYFRKRQKDGHFFDEDPKRIDYLAHVSDWIDQREGERGVGGGAGGETDMIKEQRRRKR